MAGPDGCPGKTAADCPSIVPAIDRATQRLTAMMTYLDANNADAHFKAAFCATGVDETACSAYVDTVKTNLDAMQNKRLVVWNCYSGKDGTKDCTGTSGFAGAALMTGTPKLLIGPGFYTQTVDFQSGILIHEASHAFASTVDLHDGKNGYMDSVDFDTVKCPLNADSYRKYADLCCP